MSITKIFGLFVLCALTLSPLSTTAVPVYDANGAPIENGGTSSYYMVPYIWEMGGGVTLEKTGSEACPMSVIQQHSEVSYGLPLKISSLTRTQFVTEGRVQISFAQGPKCSPHPPVWTIDHSAHGSLVKVTTPELAEKNGYFVIEKASDEKEQYPYKLSLCSDSQECGTIGIVNGEKGKRVLGITDRPFLFVLVKVETASSI